MLVLLVVVVIGVFIFLGLRAVRDVDFPVDDNGFDTSGDVDTYGDDPELDALWDQCEDGDMGACDDLYFQSPFGSEYEDFGDTCGRTRAAGGGLCDEAS